VEPDLYTTSCACGHVYDEHDDGQECTVEIDGERCMCVYFESAEEGGVKVYISGVITNGGTLDEKQRAANFARFYAEADRLRSLGHEPVNPLDLHPAPNDVSWTQAMRVDLRALLDCDAISLLEGWQESRGARLEVRVARELGLVESPVRAAPPVGATAYHAPLAKTLQDCDQVAEHSESDFEPDVCATCAGYGQVANTEHQEPWTAWANLPPGSDAAVRMRLVKPIPCPTCCAAPAEEKE